MGNYRVCRSAPQEVQHLRGLRGSIKKAKGVEKATVKKHSQRLSLLEGAGDASDRESVRESRSARWPAF